MLKDKYNDFKKNPYVYYGLLALTLIILLMVREFWFASRQGLHLDESLSFILSAYKDYGWTKGFGTLTELTGDQVRGLMWFSDDTAAGMFRDVYHLWQNNRDSPHSNLYYSALRVWFTGVNGQGDMAFIAAWAFKLNQIFFVISFFSIYLLSNEMFKGNYLPVVVVFIAFINTASISNTIFLRPYQLQEALISMYTLTSFLLTKRRLTNSFLLVHAITTSLAILSGYFAVFYVALISAFLFPYLLVKYKSKLNIALIFAVKYVSLTAVISYLIYPRYFFHKNGNRHDEALLKLNEVSDAFLSAIKSISMIDGYFPIGALITVSVSFISILLIIKDKCRDSETNYFGFVVCFSLLLWVMLVQFFAPYKVVRYIYPVLPMFGLAYGCLIYTACKYSKHRMIYSALMSVIALLASLFMYTPSKGIEYIFKNKNMECESIPDNSAIIAKQPWKLAYIATCLKGNVKYTMANDFDYLLFKSKGIATVISDYDIANENVKFNNNRVYYFNTYIMK